MIFTQEIMIISMLLTMFLFLLTGYPVAFTIAGVPLLFAIFGQPLEVPGGPFAQSMMSALPLATGDIEEERRLLRRQIEMLRDASIYPNELPLYLGLLSHTPEFY